MKFKRGDKVRHKLRDDEMIVTSVDEEEGLVYCRRYIVARDEYEKESFVPEELVPLEEKQT